MPNTKTTFFIAINRKAHEASIFCQFEITNSLYKQADFVLGKGNWYAKHISVEEPNETDLIFSMIVEPKTTKKYEARTN